MNSTLIDVLNGLNKFLAVSIVIICALIGYNSHYAGSGAYAVLGLIAGILIAAVVCGLVAAVLEIERHLRILAAKNTA